MTISFTTPKTGGKPGHVRQLHEGRFTNFAGSLNYKRHEAPQLAERPPLFLMLHGASQSASDFAVGTRMNELADECGGIVLYPEQSRSANFLGCWNWFEPRHQLADGGEPALLAGLTRAIADESGVDMQRIYVAGMSAGGAMAVILGQAYPDLYAAVGVHSGIPGGVATDLYSGLRVMSTGPSLRDNLSNTQVHRQMRVPTIVFHGDCDRTVHPTNAAAVLAQTRRQAPSPHAAAEVLATTQPIIVQGIRDVTRMTHRRDQDAPDAELWMVHGAGHAWAGGCPHGTYTDEYGPDASREMLRFFLDHPLTFTPSARQRPDERPGAALRLAA